MSYKKNRHSCYDLSYHLVVVTKYRHPVIVGEIKGRLIELSYRILEKNYPCEVLEINTDVDHIHIMFDAPPQVQLSALVNSYKLLWQGFYGKNSKNNPPNSGNQYSGANPTSSEQ